MKLIVRRHPLKFYATLILVTIFLCALATIMVLPVLKTDDNPNSKANMLVLVSLLFYILVIYTIYKYFKNAPIITVENETIAFNKKKYHFKDIVKVEMTGKQPFPYIMALPMEALTIHFSDGQKKFVFDDLHANTWELKSYIKRYLELGQTEITTTFKAAKNDIEKEYFEVFKGPQLLSLRGISAWGFLAFFGFLFFLKGKPGPGAFLFLLLLGLFWFGVNSWLMHYYKVSKNFLVVKNHNFFWKTHIYRISEIEEIVFESQGKQPNCLRVIEKNYKNKLYPGGTLRDKKWLELKDNLEKKGVKVRNECI